MHQGRFILESTSTSHWLISMKGSSQQGNQDVDELLSIYVCIDTYIYTHAAYMHIHLLIILKYVSVYVHMCTHINIYIYIYMHCVRIYIYMLAPPGTYLLTLFGGSEGLCCMQSSAYLCLCSNNVENCRSKTLQFSINHHGAFAQCITI